MAANNAKEDTPVRRRSALATFLWLFGALLIFGYVLFRLEPIITFLGDVVASHKLVFFIWRMSLIAALFWFWGPVTDWVGRRRDLPAEELVILKNLRTTAVVMLLVVEVVMVQRLPLHILRYFNAGDLPWL